MTDPLKPNTGVFLMGNEAIVRGALEAGVQMATGYPGTPSSEIIETLARSARPGQLYVDWSINETVAMEVAAAASLAQLRSLCVMQQNGVNVASDFLLHLVIAGTRGGGLCWLPATIREGSRASRRGNPVSLRASWRSRCWSRRASRRPRI